MLRAMDQRARSALVGAGAGAAATVAMSAVMGVFDAIGVLESQPPREITSRTLTKAGVSHDPESAPHNIVSALSHLAFGAIAGAAYAPLEDEVTAPPIASGVAWATGVWATSYLGFLPALGLQPPPRSNAPRLVPMLVAHWVYGAVLGAIVEKAGDAWGHAIWERQRRASARH